MKQQLKVLEVGLDAKAYAKYTKLTVDQIKSLVVDDKWLVALSAAAHGEVEAVSQSLTQGVKVLAERYETPLPKLTKQVSDLETDVIAHLAKMGFAWN